MQLHGPTLSRIDFGLIAGLAPADAVAARVAWRGEPHWEATSREFAMDLHAGARAPVYLPHDASTRVVSRPANRWRIERRTAAQGTREVDPWLPISPDMAKGPAIERMFRTAKAR